MEGGGYRGLRAYVDQHVARACDDPSVELFVRSKYTKYAIPAPTDWVAVDEVSMFIRPKGTWSLGQYDLLP